MINRLLDQIKKNNEIIKTIQQQKTNCNKCKDGKIIHNDFLKALRENKKIYCNCIVYNNKYLHEYETENVKMENIIMQIKTNIPAKFQNNCFFEKIDERIKNFLISPEIFLWIYGKTGNGKTYSLYAILIEHILKNKNIYDRLYIVNESEFNYKTHIRNFIVLDDVSLSKKENRNICLADDYYNLINYKYENNKKLIMTSNFDVATWIKSIALVNEMAARRIESRFHNNLITVNLGDQDLRKILK